MTRAVVFDTPGLLDFRSFTRFGVNAKPLTDSPIGFFGTGLKYAIAVLVRNEIPITIYIGDNAYEFYKKKEKFRDKDFDFVRCRKRSWFRGWSKPKYEELPFTTELGKNWDLWMVFRELYTNTIDEGGATRVDDGVLTLKNRTRIVVEGEVFVQEFFERDKNFLPEGLRERKGSERLQVFDKPSKHLYYRGMRIYDLPKPSVLTYNFLCDVKLTEDRTAHQPGILDVIISQYLLECDDVERLRSTLMAKDKYESGLQFTHHYAMPSAAFRQVSRYSGLGNLTAAPYTMSHTPRVAQPNPLEERPRPWVAKRDGDGQFWYVVDAAENFVTDLDKSLSPEEVHYMLALLSKDLEDDEFDAWAKNKDQPVAENSTKPTVQELDDDVPF